MNLKNESGFSLVELMVAIGLMSVLGMGIIECLAMGERYATGVEKRTAVAAELTRQLAQARALPMSSLLNGGAVPVCTVSADWTTAQFQNVVEPFFSLVGLNTWITRNTTGDPRIFAISGTGAAAQTVRVQWRLTQGTLPVSQERYYAIEVLAKMDNGLGSNVPIVMYGRTIRAFEAETRN